MESELEKLRRRVDDLNSRLLELLQERAGTVLRISRLKEDLDLDAHDPRREEEMLRKLTRSPSGPFGAAEVREIFQAIFRASLALQKREREQPQYAEQPLPAGSEVP
jgi:3-deoxy-7-phosphoheptulonate synthase/chorismate mutase